MINKPHWWDEDEDGEWKDELHTLDVPFLGAEAERVCCSCGKRDSSLQFGCCRCGRPVHYNDSDCGGWLLDSWHDDAATENEFWCRQCLADDVLDVEVDGWRAFLEAGGFEGMSDEAIRALIRSFSDKHSSARK